MNVTKQRRKKCNKGGDVKSVASFKLLLSIPHFLGIEESFSKRFGQTHQKVINTLALTKNHRQEIEVFEESLQTTKEKKSTSGSAGERGNGYDQASKKSLYLEGRR